MAIDAVVYTRPCLVRRVCPVAPNLGFVKSAAKSSSRVANGLGCAACAMASQLNYKYSISTIRIPIHLLLLVDQRGWILRHLDRLTPIVIFLAAIFFFVFFF